MQVLIPAGMGKRLGQETSDKTKAMVKVCENINREVFRFSSTT